MSLLPLLLLMEVMEVCCGALIVLTSDVRVPRGGSAPITQQHLNISVDQGHDCVVEVIYNEPLSQKVGQLTPQMFPCSFLQDQVSYQHHGSPLLETDRVLLRVYSFSWSQTQMETVTLSVGVSHPDPGEGLAELGPTPLEVPGFYARSNTINSSVLTIRAPQGALCTVRLISPAPVPAMGRLVREEATIRTSRQAALCPGNQACGKEATEVNFLKTSCDDFLNFGLKYEHLQPPSPQMDYIPIKVELREEGRMLLQVHTEIGVKPLKGGARETCVVLESMQEDMVVYSVKCSREVEKNEEGCGTGIRSHQQ
ncbi:FRAS1-related extracellular matrix protein 1-like, partial [Gouania willdenowi]|uniref:FRAS1-related extracellular matrix protein 1-like n=1 Tax=Gouania willdenowi TaxID=441366 RepID=UPI00105573EC